MFRPRFATPQVPHPRAAVLGRVLVVLAALVAVIGPGVRDAAPARAAELEGGTLDWGVKASFRSYVTGPIAHGGIAVADGASANGDGTFRFPATAGSTDGPSSLSGVFGGEVRFTGHEEQGAPQLDVTLTDLRVTITGSIGSVQADVVSRPLGASSATTYSDIVFADLSPAGPGTKVAGTTTWTAVPAALTAAGAEAFAGFYTAGTVLDALTVTVTDAGPVTTTTTPAAPEPTVDTTSVAPTTSPPAAPAPTTTTTTTIPTTPVAPAPMIATGGTVVGGYLDWGLKQSFRSYIMGPIAQGRVAVEEGASNNADGTFRFPASPGSRVASAVAVDAATDGVVHFTGHDGLLDLVVSDVVIEIDGSVGRVVADVRSKALDAAAPTTFDGVTLASLDLTGIGATADGTRVTWTGIPAVLAEGGAGAFAGFYTSGTALDPLTLVLDLDGGLAGLPAAPTPVPSAVAPAVTTSATSVASGGSLTVAGSGFDPGEQVQVFVHSTPRFIAVIVADGQGRAGHTFSLPADLEAGAHRVELRGVSTGRSIFSEPITVGARAGARSLPATGQESGTLAAVAVLLLVVGVTLELASRRRHPA